MNQNQVPIPQGKYVPATRFGQLVYTAGMTPRRSGVLIQTGKVEANAPLEDYRDAVRQAAENALIAARSMTGEGEQVTQLLAVQVYVNGGEGFTQHSAVADLASDYFYEQLGQGGVASRAALGMASLPGNAPVEISLVAVIS